MDGGIARRDGEDEDSPTTQDVMVMANVPSVALDGSLTWEPFLKGIEIHKLYDNPGGPRAALLRYEPGACLGRHDHQGHEHIFVLSGSQTDDHGEHRVGTLIIHPPGTSHAVTSASGCIVLAIWEKPVVFWSDGKRPMAAKALITE